MTATAALFAMEIDSGTTGTSHSITSKRFRGFAPGQVFFLSYLYTADRTTGSGILALRQRIAWYKADGTLVSNTDSTINIDADVLAYTLVEAVHTAPALAVEGEIVITATPAASPMQHDLSVTAIRLGKTQSGADVTSYVDGPTESTIFHYDHEGTAESGEFNRDLTFKLYNAAGQITSGITWTYTVKTGIVNTFDSTDGAQSMSGTGTGTMTVSSLGSAANSVEITATYLGVARKKTINLNKVFAAPPTGSDPTIASKSSGWTDITSTSFADISGTITGTMPTGKTTATISGVLTATPTPLTGTGSWTIEMKVQRYITGVWTDTSSTFSGLSETDSGTLLFAAEVSIGDTDSSLTAGNTYDWRIMARRTAGTKNHSVTGSVAIVASA